METFPGRNFIQVKKVASIHQQGLEVGDIIVKQGHTQVTQLSDLCDMFVHQHLRMSVVRRQVEVEIDVPTVTVSSRQSGRVVWFAGAQLEPPYSPVQFCTRELYSQIFVTNVCTGSPAEMYGIQRHHFITKVQGVATPNLNDFTEATDKIPDGQYCQLTLVSPQGSPSTISLRLDRKYFNTVDARWQGSGWQFAS